jgi:hypothetical protein
MKLSVSFNCLYHCWPKFEEAQEKILRMIWVLRKEIHVCAKRFVASEKSCGHSTGPAKQNTDRSSNFEHRDPKVGVFLKSTEATPCGHFSKWKLTPENPLWKPCPWPWFSHEKLLKIFKVLWKIRNFERSHFKNLYIAGMGPMSSNWSSLKACF